MASVFSLRGMPAVSEIAVRRALSVADLVVTNATDAELTINGGRAQRLPPSRVARAISRFGAMPSWMSLSKTDEYKNQARATVQYRIDIDVPIEGSLAEVDMAFVKYLAKPRITMADIAAFSRGIGRTRSAGDRRAPALSAYATAVLIKDQDPLSGITLPFAAHVEKLRAAIVGLEQIERPLAQLIRSIVQLNLNHFDVEGLPDGVPPLAQAMRLYAAVRDAQDPTLPPIHSVRGVPLCPIDATTEDILDTIARPHVARSARGFERLWQAANSGLV